MLAGAGVASRRECEQLILEGRVEVDRKVVTELGTRVLDSQEIRLDGQPLRVQAKRVYYLVNKPMGVVSTNRDPDGRMRVIDLVPEDCRLFTVGRLDRNSEGLILVTNDGELANRLAHPRFGIEKTYNVQVAGHPRREQLDVLLKGVYLAEGKAEVASVRVRKRTRENTLLEIVLKEGRNREIRRVLARIGHKVLRLKRVALGPLRLGDLPTGAARPLRPDELRKLRRGGSNQAAGRGGKRKPAATGSGSSARAGSTRTATAKGTKTAGKAAGKAGGKTAAAKPAAKTAQKTRGSGKSALPQSRPSLGTVIGGEATAAKREARKRRPKKRK